MKHRNLFLDRLPNRNFNQFETNTISYSKTELSNIKSKLSLLEEDMLKINISQLRKQQEEIGTIKNVCSYLRATIEKSQLQNQVILEWKKHTETVLESLRNQFKFEENLKRQNEHQIRSIEGRLMVLDNIFRDLKTLEGNMIKEQLNNREEQNDLKAKLEELKDVFLEENAAICAIWNDQKINIETLSDGINNTNKTVDDLKLKHSALVFDVRTINQIAEEASEKVEILENQFEKLRSELLEIKSCIQSLEQKSSPSSEGVGRCLWIISEFSGKMKLSKETSNVLKGPFFYTHEYGYKVRVSKHHNIKEIYSN